MKTIILSLAFLLMTANGHPHPQVSGSVGVPYISWEMAAEKIERGDASVIPQFLQHHNVDTEGNFNGWSGHTLLLVAARRGNSDGLKKLLAAGANINHKDEKGWSALYWAALHGQTESLKILIKQPGINVNIRTNGGWTPLMSAASELGGYPDAVKILLQHPAIETNAETDDGDTALGLADNAAIKIMLQDRGAVCKCGPVCRRSNNNC